MGAASFRVPGYLIDSLLGRGATSEVWLGRVADTLEPVALKRITLPGTDQVVAARAEAALLAELDHPNLIRLHEFVTDGVDATLVLDLATGASLADLLTARGSLTPGEVISALAPIAAALAYLHDAGVVHGDVAPGNILFTDDGQPMLADLGVARLLGDRATVRSTPAYIDPGVAAGFMPAPQSDVFMLGGVALHCLTGQPLWPGKTAEDALFTALAANLTGLDERLNAARVPGEMRAVLRRALAVEPARRGTAADFALDLRYSAEPTAVELSAGRARSAPHPVPPISAERSIIDTDEFAAVPAEDDAIDAAPAADEVWPAGEVWPTNLDEPASPAQTHIAQPLPRPVKVNTHRYRARWRRTWVRWAVAGGCVAALAGGAVAWGIAGNGNRAATASRVTPLVTNSPAPLPVVGIPVETSTNSDTSTDTGSAAVSGQDATASVQPVSAADVQNVLIGIDTLREQAFARRAPLLLTGVYVPGPLLDEDTASLDRIVPSGCGLAGVHTSYSNVVITSQSATEVSIEVKATLSESILFCGGTAKAKAAGSGPTKLRITLLRSGSGYLIETITT